MSAPAPTERAPGRPAALPAGWRAEAHETIDAIAAADWDACAGGGSAYISHAHLRALEHSAIAAPANGFTPRHLTLRDAAGTVIAVAPAYLKTHSRGELGVDLGLAMAHQRAAGPYYPKLQVEVPMTPIAGPRLLVRPGGDGATARAALLAALQAEAGRCDAASLQLAYLSHEDRAAAAAAGLLASEGNVYVWRPRGLSSMAALLAGMSSHRRTMIRRERREVAAYGLATRRIAGAELDAAWAERFFALYARTFARHNHEIWLNVDYFRRLFRDLGDAVEILAAFDGGTCVAAALLVRSPATLYVQHWGQSGEHRFLHFELALYRSMERALELGFEALDCGTTGRHKAPRGIGIEATHHAAWFRAPAFAAAAASGLAHKRAAARAERLAELGRLPFPSAPVPDAGEAGLP